jgi:hypothetical protein
MKTRILGMLAFGLLAGLASNVKADFVADGGFTETAPAGGYTRVDAGQSFGGANGTAWTVIPGSMNTPGSGSVDVISSSFPGLVTPPDGSNSVDLDGSDAPPAGGITQTLTGLTVGASYILSFEYIGQSGYTPNFSVMLGNSTVVNAMSVTNSTSYTLFTTTYSATDTSAALTFISNDAPGSYNGVIIADVSVNSAAVPEPASCAMLGMGVLAIGAFGRYRRRNA